MIRHLKWIEINKKSLLHNVKEFRRIVSTPLINRDQNGLDNPPRPPYQGGTPRIYSVVKANAYGHGLTEVATVIKEEVYGFAVNHIDEAIVLRNAGIKNPILTLGYTLLDRLKEAVENDITLCVYNRETIDELGVILRQTQRDRLGKVHIKVDTGLSRQGVFPEDVLDFIKYIQKFKNIEIEGIYTHFANIEDTTDHSYAEKQLKTFESVLQTLEKNNIEIPIKHTACTAAAILFPQTYFNAVRVGIGTYGLWSSNETKISAANSDRLNLNLQPVMTWKTRVAQVKWIPANTPVGYGLTFFTTRKTMIAILPVGYSDGYDRKLSNNSYVVIKNKRCPVLGRIMMNTIVVDVTEVEDVKPEDEVILLGNGGMSAEEMASKIGSINYEVVTRVNWNMPRVVV